MHTVNFKRLFFFLLPFLYRVIFQTSKIGIFNVLLITKTVRKKCTLLAQVVNIMRATGSRVPFSTATVAEPPFVPILVFEVVSDSRETTPLVR